LQNRIFGSKTPAFNVARHKRISPLHLRYSALNLVADASAHQRVPAKNHRCFARAELKHLGGFCLKMGTAHI
jgi:hypothetical protein